jgi:drug/metabolite transporter (DMT)-like permease
VSRARIAELALIGVALVWGVTFVMVQDAVEEMPVLTFLAIRFLAAAAIVAPFVVRPVRALGRGGARAGLLMGTFLTLGYVFQTFALQHTTASNVGFITGMVVVLTPLLGALVLRMSVPPIAYASALVAAVGLALLSGVGGEVRALGDGLALGCAAAFAFHLLATDRAVARFDVGALLFVQLTVCGVASLVAAAALGQLEAPTGLTVWSALIVTAVLASAAAFFIQSYAQKHTSPDRTALILASEPAFAGLFGWWLAGDAFTALSLAGASLIIVAIVMVDLVPRLRPPRPLPEA